MPSRIDGLSQAQLQELERLLTTTSTEAAQPEEATEREESELVAYFVPEGPAPSAAELRAHAARMLPASHVPVRFVAVAELPRLTGGKLDRRALLRAAALAEETTEADVPAGEPSDDVEQWLAGVWSVVLDVPTPALDADFFALGGSSLRAVQVLARVETVLGVELRLAAFFEHPTLRSFAAMVRDQSERVPGFAEIVAVAAEVYAQDAPGSAPVDAPLTPTH
jgi:acyl carrier protein